MSNPLLQGMPEHGLPDFAAITPDDFRQAIDRGFAEHEAEIAAIAGDDSEPDFANTVEALERSGALLDRVMSVFSNLVSSDTNEELQALELEFSPRAALHESHIYTNTTLFERIRAVRGSAAELEEEQGQLLDNTYRHFVRAGAQLDPQGRQRMEEINGSLARLTTQFSQNVLADSNAYQLLLDESQLGGLPKFVREAAATEARSRGRDGFLFTLSRSSITPFLQYSDHRDLREDIYRAYTRCGENRVDNHTVIRQIIALRAERARLLGYETHADYMLEQRMAKTPDRVIELLEQVWAPCRDKVASEARDLQALIDAEGGDFDLAPWDWFYYTEKLRQQRYQLDESEVMPYFSLAQVRDGAFEVARKLYGISFHPRRDVPLYHPDVQAFEVREADGSRIGLFLFDFYMRPSKRSGAWMSTFRDQSALDGHVEPVIVNCCNFPHGDPCLLGMDEVRTLFHEFGHGLHGLLSKVRYRSLSGTHVKQDFVELPSQIMEHWAMEPEVLKDYARHVDTGEPIPDALIDRLRAAAKFNTGFAATEYLAACFLDMAWHGKEGEQAEDVAAFELKVAEKTGNRTVVDPRYRSSYFQHIFSDDYYSAGYYVYIWAEVLDADGFEAFKENGLFDQETARAFRSNILERGGSEDPMTLYRRFRGRDPEVKALLKNRGLA
ncbi:M3 family peptidase [Seongchinamella unica]|uniref:M3 family peptidase n=1 Tax=Seongchinamella unica TaxID=2547392 RepID=A0A4V2ZWW3_9GAMM|nr:M3 family metallopeptidase [Seongchinamella unica]TDG11888.1 M3 family peptidase [Seongchinamella unica]